MLKKKIPNIEPIQLHKEKDYNNSIGNLSFYYVLKMVIGRNIKKQAKYKIYS